MTSLQASVSWLCLFWKCWPKLIGLTSVALTRFKARIQRIWHDIDGGDYYWVGCSIGQKILISNCRLLLIKVGIWKEWHYCVTLRVAHFLGAVVEFQNGCPIIIILTAGHYDHNIMLMKGSFWDKTVQCFFDWNRIAAMLIRLRKPQ